MLSQEKTLKLLEAKDYRQFLVFWIESSIRKTWGAYAAISKKAGFSSRTHFGDIVSGKRRITPKTFLRIIDAIDVRGEFKIYFKWLVCMEEKDFRSQGMTVDQIRLKLIQSKNRILKRENSQDSAQKIILKVNWVEIYAALGTLELGADLTKIALRTGLSISSVKTALLEMEKLGAIRKQDGVYFSTGSHVVSNAIDEIHKEYILRAFQDAHDRIKTRFEMDNHLYWKSVFSIKSECAPQFKEQLRELILKFVDRTEDPHGDSIGQITIAFELNLNK